MSLSVPAALLKLIVLTLFVHHLFTLQVSPQVSKLSISLPLVVSVSLSALLFVSVTSTSVCTRM